MCLFNNLCFLFLNKDYNNVQKGVVIIFRLVKWGEGGKGQRILVVSQPPKGIPPKALYYSHDTPSLAVK